MGGGNPVMYELRGLNEECGLFGIWGHPEASELTYMALHSLQHRARKGQESLPAAVITYLVHAVWDC